MLYSIMFLTDKEMQIILSRALSNFRQFSSVLIEFNIEIGGILKVFTTRLWNYGLRLDQVAGILKLFFGGERGRRNFITVEFQMLLDENMHCPKAQDFLFVVFSFSYRRKVTIRQNDHLHAFLLAPHTMPNLLNALSPVSAPVFQRFSNEKKDFPNTMQHNE